MKTKVFNRKISNHEAAPARPVFLYAAAKILLIVLMLAVFVAAFTGCDSFMPENNPPPLSFPAEYTAEISFGEFSGKAVIAYESYECYSLSFTEPSTVAGFTVILENSVCRYEMFGAATEHKAGDMPSSTAPAFIFSVLKSLMTKAYSSAEYADGKWRYEGIAQGKMFAAEQDGTTGRLLSISVPGAELEVLFRD